MAAAALAAAETVRAGAHEASGHRADSGRGRTWSLTACRYSRHCSMAVCQVRGWAYTVFATLTKWDERCADGRGFGGDNYPTHQESHMMENPTGLGVVADCMIRNTLSST
eukprot:365109-Chlamydomonas_euryale.AAC.7